MEQVTKGYKLKRVRNLGKNLADGTDYMRNFQESLKPWEEIAGICLNKKARILYGCFFSFYFFPRETCKKTLMLQSSCPLS